MAIKNMTVPDIGGATDVAVIEVLVKPGDVIKVDSSLIVLESDKATMEVPSSDAGIVKEVKVKSGDKVNVGSVILVLEITENSTVSVEKKEVSVEPVKSVAPSTPPVATMAPVISRNEDDVHAGPAVRRFARQLGVTLLQVTGTGPKQRILKEDVQNYIKARLSTSTITGAGLPTAPSVDFSKWGEVESKALSRIKKLSGKNLHRNWLLVPHVTQLGEADITELEQFRQEQKKQSNEKLTPLVFIMKAVTVCLKKFPQFNASLDSTAENIILKKYFHIGVAVDTPDGLVVPVIRDVEKKGILELSKELREVSEKARQGQLTAQDMQGGCFTISSLGGIGGTAFTPIINVPEVAILGVSKSSHQPIFQEGVFVPRLMLPLSLSYDHRVIDGADGARFITHLTDALSDVRNLLM